jgi:hypothetical protein
MGSQVRLLVIKRNKKTLTYPTYENIVCENMEGVVEMANGHTRFTAISPRAIPTLYEVENTLSQIKALCNRCCSSTSAA